ncbi:MAG: hypothetical protein M0R00_06405 [Candidatus Omnitrophica bacterium]|jgi:hypothetical protein|nr:hypothetical protein [Candidatus Omnitrophota bacterium]
MNTVSLKCLGDWQKKISVPLRNVLNVSMDVFGRTGADACKHAIILMAQSASAMTKQAPKNRKVEQDPRFRGMGGQFIRIFKKNGQETKSYRFGLKDKAEWDKFRLIAHRGMAKRSWMWGLKGLDASKVTSKPFPGVAHTMTILNEKSCGYILQNTLSYLLKILPTGWEAAVMQKAGNKIMKQAAMKIERQWRSELARPRRAGMAVARGLASYFTRAA